MVDESFFDRLRHPSLEVSGSAFSYALEHIDLLYLDLAQRLRIELNPSAREAIVALLGAAGTKRAQETLIRYAHELLKKGLVLDGGVFLLAEIVRQSRGPDSSLSLRLCRTVCDYPHEDVQIAALEVLGRQEDLSEQSQGHFEMVQIYGKKIARQYATRLLRGQKRRATAFLM